MICVRCGKGSTGAMSSECTCNSLQNATLAGITYGGVKDLVNINNYHPNRIDYFICAMLKGGISPYNVVDYAKSIIKKLEKEEK